MFDYLTGVTKKIFGDANERELKVFEPMVLAINALEPEYEALSDELLQGKTGELKERVKNGESLDSVLVEAFAIVREVAKRTLGMRHYDCQMIGGIVLHQGKIAEMKTGEGKTLVATLPVYLHALEEKGVHVVTVNDYLAKRDAEWMGPVYEFLGMTVGSILTGERNDGTKRAAYACDITYGTNNEFGFDYLRDHMKFSEEEMTQRGHRYCIIDEVDSILVDEARTPLIISGPMSASIDLYRVVDAVIPLLLNEVDFVLDEKSKNASLTDAGISKVESKLGIGNLYDPQNMEVLHHVHQSLKAHHVFKRDKDYVVRESKVVIVDEFTGRLMHGRRWSDGLHQAMEAKEKVSVEQESQVYATITFQNLFRMYDTLSGMTGTAATEAAEFASIYDLDTVIIPTNEPLIRDDRNDVIYKTQMAKFRAVVAEIKDCHERGQPVLVGTTSVEKSEIVSKLLERKKVPHEVLNAKNHSREAIIVAQAGQKGAVTISTNMAGRGTDIRLGGNLEFETAQVHDPEEEPEAYETLLESMRGKYNATYEEVKSLGGLHIIGTERHESRRVDNQLRGRSGRQGDPGSSRFHLSLEDELLRIFGSDKVTVWMERMGLKDDEVIEHRWIDRAVENAQKKVEGFHFNSRKNLLEYDDVMNFQRTALYELRNRALLGEEVQTLIFESMENVVQDIMDDFFDESLRPEQWNLDGARENLNRVFGISWEESDEVLRDSSRIELKKRMSDDIRNGIESTIEKVEEESFTQYSRMLILHYIDRFWKDHLLALDRLRQGVGLRGYGQRNPLLEYKREALQMFHMMCAMRDEKILSSIYHVEADVIQSAAQSPGKAMARRLVRSPAEVLAEMNRKKAVRSIPRSKVMSPVVSTAPAGNGMPDATTGQASPPKQPKTGRNEPCPCGSGKKYKKCCLLGASPS